MTNEAKEKIIESGSSVPVRLAPDVENAGVVARHEDEEHREIAGALENTGASVSNAATPPDTQGLGMVKLPEAHSNPDRNSPVSDTGRYRKFVDFIRSARTRRGGLERAA